jgi:major membrane immunogen (membrane-anchored lipoprotein)
VTLIKTLTAVCAVALIAGCGSSTTPENTGTTSSTGTAAPEMTDQQSPPERVVIDVTIAGGNVTPTNQQVQAKVKQPIIVRVNSDAADQLHVHSNPEHTFDIKPENGQAFQFTVDVPGKVDVELHHLDKTVATITVQ